MKKFNLRFLLILFIVATSCESEHIQQKPLINTRWTLIALQSTSDNSYASYPETLKKQSVIFKDSVNTMLISGICNACTGTFSMSSGGINTTVAGCTKIYCDGVEWEQLLLTNLKNTYSYIVGNNSMTLLSSGGYNLIFSAD